MQYWSLKPPFDAFEVYVRGRDNVDFDRAYAREDFAGQVLYGQEDHFDDHGKRLKVYNVSIFYSALCIPEDKAAVVVDKLDGLGFDYETAEIITESGRFIAFRSFNALSETDTVPMGRIQRPGGDFWSNQYYSEEFLQFLDEQFDISAFGRTRPRPM